MITEKERRKIQRYCIYPRIAKISLILSLVSVSLLLPLELIGVIFLDSKFFNEFGFYFGCCGIFGVYFILMIYCSISVLWGIKGKKWAALVEKQKAAQTENNYKGEISSILATKATVRLLKRSDINVGVAGKVSDTAANVTAIVIFVYLLNDAQQNAENMANVCGVPIPNFKRLRIIAMIPIAIFANLFLKVKQRKKFSAMRNPK